MQIQLVKTANGLCELFDRIQRSVERSPLVNHHSKFGIHRSLIAIYELEAVFSFGGSFGREDWVYDDSKHVVHHFREHFPDQVVRDSQVRIDIDFYQSSPEVFIDQEVVSK